MPSKHRGDIDYRFPEGAFQVLNPTDPLQLYRVFECEASRAKSMVSDTSPSHKILMLCTSGEGEVQQEDVFFHMSPSTVLFLPKGDFCLKTTSDKGACRCVCVAFDIISKNMTNSGDVSEILSFFYSQDAAICAHNADAYFRVFSSFMAELSLPHPTMLLLKGFFYQTIVTAYRCFSDHLVSPSLDTINIHAVGHTVYAIICYIDEHLFSMNNLMEMAQELGYSYNYLSHLFRKKTGMTIQMYVSRKKIEQSTKLLSEEQYSITEIASMLNYDCIQSFSKAFRRAMGMSPTEYRTLHGVRNNDL